MKKLFEKKINIILIIALLILIVVTIVAIIIWQMTTKPLKEEVSYDDKIICKNYFESIAINLDVKKVKRDGTDTTLKEEFGVSEEEENDILSSKEKLREFLTGSTFEISKQEGNVIYIKNDYQTKKIILKSESQKIEKNNSFNAISVRQMPSGLYILEYDTKKRAKAAEEYFSEQTGIKVIKDEVVYLEEISDESQTMYGEIHDDLPEGTNSRGVVDLGLDNFKRIINENGNPSEVVVATVGYGACVENSFFDGRISDKYYNFIDNKKEVSETISQGSRIAEVIVDSTSNNVKLLPIKVVNEQGCTSIVALVNAIEYATRFGDVVCYELVNKQNDAIDISLKNAYKEEKPICAVTAKGNIVYPASYETTIATASVNKNFEIATYSGSGEYIDFAASSTDIKEIFSESSTVSRWSGVQYANAFIASEIALLKTYNKDFKIIDVYNELIKYSQDYGNSGKDEAYGYGVPKFNGIQISDLDKVAPEMQDIQFNDEQWEKTKNIKISAKDNIRILGWQISNSEDVPNEWNNLNELTSVLDTESEITSNGKYYIWVKDSANNTSNKQIEVNKIDNIAPNITYTINKDRLFSDGYVTINVEAQDDGSGMAETPYSWDNISWGKENNILKVTDNGRYTIYCRDNVGNVATKEITIDSFAIKAEAIIDTGNVIKSITPSTSWNNNTNQDVQIILKNTIDVVAWQITTENVEPRNYVEIKQNTSDVQSTNNQNSISNTSVSTDTVNTNNNVTSTNTANAQNENNTLSSPQNILNINTNTISQNNDSKYNSSNTYVAVTASFDAGTTYYVWVKDSRGSVYSQSFKIKKVEF